MTYYNQFSRILFVFLALALITVNAPAQRPRRNQVPNNQPTNTAAAATPEINFTVSMSKPYTHLLEVEMRVRQNRLPDNLELVMPVWTPGSYLVREYARHVQDFAARGANNQNLTWEKTDKNTWRINTNGANEAIVTYRVYSNELTVRTNELNDQHAFWNNTALLLHPKGQINVPSTVRVVPFQNWKVATGLPPVRGQANTFRAANFDVLYDSPFECGNFREATFEFRNVPHRIVIEGEGNYDLERMRRDIPKIVEQAVAIFGEIPYENYLFIVNLRGGGGLEHLNSTALQWNRFGFRPEARYIGFLTLVAHEYFHLWNVKRLRPDALGPFDYSNENYTKLLWVAEGATSYYENILMRRAGFITPTGYLSDRAVQIQDLQRRPGRFQTSVEEASFDAWIKYYRQDENSINNQISYYDKGEIVAMLLDLEIRRASNGARTMDDVMRALYTDFFKQNRNYTPADFQTVSERVAGRSLDDFFRRYVRGREELDYNQILSDFGLRLETTAGGAPTVYLGADFSPAAGGLTISALPAGTPAYDGGLNTGDQILAVDGIRVTSQADLNTRLGEKRPGDRVRMTFFRFDELRELTITLGGRARDEYRFVPVQSANQNQVRLYEGWIGGR